MRRTGGSRSSPRGGDRRLAPRGRGSGRRSCADAEARRHGTLRLTRRGAPVSQPTPGHGVSGPGSPGRLVFAEEVLASAFEVGHDNAYRESLVSDVEYTTEPPFTLTYSHPSRGQVERRRADQRRRLRLHPPGARSRSPGKERSAHSWHRWSSTCAASRPSTGRRSRSFFAPASPAGAGCSQNVLPRHALAGRDLETVWSDRIDNPKTGAPIGSGPFLVERWERGQKLTLRRNPNYFGPHRAYLERLEVRFIVPPPERVAAVRSGAVDFAVGLGDPDVVPELRREAGLRVLAAQQPGRRALRAQAGPRRAPCSPEQARAPGTRVRDRPRRDLPSALRRRRPEAAPARQHAPLDAERALRAELAPVSIQARAGPPAPRAGRLSPRLRRRLRVRRKAARASLRHQRRDPTSPAGFLARPCAAHSGGYRGGAGLRLQAGALRPDHPARRLRRRLLRLDLLP